ncbi:hypothetical protein O9649_28215 [Achromobacter dolens]|uniref:hypothetical protein n=1 Tax=Achromobacter dolens TaxID=1287738 RepID=UPI0022B8834D|nr:hypothetical protein [Achromobacter dolens]MCZ8411683.1 hypothetical protein [Achromobacter dolens]
MKNTLHRLADIMSGEFILRWFESNGGTVIVLRAVYITFWVMYAAAVFILWVDPSWPETQVLSYIGKRLIDLLPWCGPVFGGVYLALYARFSSQWTYLAGVYNQIKQAEVSAANTVALDQWRAGYIEDAYFLHLALKPSVASVIHAWLKDEGVKTAFEAHTPGGSHALARLCTDVERIVKQEEERWRERASS